MSNHHRGLWGYWGHTPGGGELTVQATGIGGPSAAVVLGELADAGLRTAIRVGTCAAAGPGIAAGATIVARGLEPELTAALIAGGAGEAADLISGDTAPHRLTTGERDADGRVCRDMQTASLVRAAADHEIRIAATFVVVEAEGRALEDDALEDRCERLGRIAAEVLADASAGQPETDLKLNSSLSA